MRSKVASHMVVFVRSSCHEQSCLILVFKAPMLWYILSESWNLGIRLVVFVTGSVLGSVLGSQPDMVWESA